MTALCRVMTTGSVASARGGEGGRVPSRSALRVTAAVAAVLAAVAVAVVVGGVFGADTLARRLVNSVEPQFILPPQQEAEPGAAATTPSPQATAPALPAQPAPTASPTAVPSSTPSPRRPGASPTPTRTPDIPMSGDPEPEPTPTVPETPALEPVALPAPTGEALRISVLVDGTRVVVRDGNGILFDRVMRKGDRRWVQYDEGVTVHSDAARNVRVTLSGRGEQR